MPAPTRVVAIPGVLARVRAWGRRWGLPGLDARVRIEWSPRLRRALGRALPRDRVVRLAPRLADGPRDALLAVLCHELAHVAVAELHPHRCRPHGVEWQRLVRAAGFAPEARLPAPAALAGRAPAPTSRDRYVHRCPVCHMRRTARRPVPRWRCATCVAAGLPGRLSVQRIRSGAPG